MNILVVQRESLVARVGFSLSVYARIIEAMVWLKDHRGVDYAVCGEDDPYIMEMLKWAKIVVFCKHFSNKAQQIALMAKKSGCQTLLDIDDWVFEFPEYSGSINLANDVEVNILNMLKVVDFVSVANSVLKESLSGIRDDCILVPNGIYVERYKKYSEFEIHPQRVVFANADFIKIQNFRKDFIRVLSSFSAKNKSVIFDYYGDVSPDLTSIDFMFVSNRIPYDDFLNCLIFGGYAIAIIPLGGEEDGDAFFFNSCKNPFKYLNYAVAGIPGIYSNVKIYRECVTNNVTGVLVDNKYDEWMDALDNLLLDFDLRQKIRNNAYSDVYENHHIKKTSSILYEMFT